MRINSSQTWTIHRSSNGRLATVSARVPGKEYQARYAVNYSSCNAVLFVYLTLIFYEKIYVIIVSASFHVWMLTFQFVSKCVKYSDITKLE